MKIFYFIQIYETRIINGMVPLFTFKLCLNSFLTSDWSQQIQWDWWCRAIIIKIWKLSPPSIEILFYFHYFWTMCTKVWRFVVCVPLQVSLLQRLSSCMISQMTVPHEKWLCDSVEFLCGYVKQILFGGFFSQTLMSDGLTRQIIVNWSRKFLQQSSCAVPTSGLFKSPFASWATRKCFFHCCSPECSHYYAQYFVTGLVYSIWISLTLLRYLLVYLCVCKMC